ncbi:hypothetical protein BDR03DRAFT_64579 [Suillus americanus]|nr:hypothetical protein BDR03DRAFT_64579 [Suillus americanus]
MDSGEQRSVRHLPSVPRSIFEYISKKDKECIQNIAASRFGPMSTSNDLRLVPHSPRLPGSHTPNPTSPKLLSAGFSPSWPIPLSRQGTLPISVHMQIPAQVQFHSHRSLGRHLRSSQTRQAIIQKQLHYSVPFLEPWLGGLQVPLFWIEGLHTPAAKPEEGADSIDVTEEKPREEVKAEAPKVQAARPGTYGAVMREVCMWQPARLLCKRFGVKVPDLGVPIDTSGPSAQVWCLNSYAKRQRTNSWMQRSGEWGLRE